MNTTYQYRRFALFLVVLLINIIVYAQGTTNRAYWSYIDKYKNLAILHQNKYNIPASITLAQGLYESNAGRSTLATQAHNHFGIKTPGGWTGPYVLRNDDRPNERFRKYNTDEESYEDHSKFLQKPRYKVLFTYKIDDYKSWAYGLKACGYATNPAYPEALIRIIESYSLNQLDHMKMSKYPEYDFTTPNFTGHQPSFLDTHTVYVNNGRYFIIVEDGDDLETISRGTGISKSRLRRFNELPKDYKLAKGDIIFLQNKKKYASKEFAGYYHEVEAGQSIYDISQLYGMRLESLYRLNALPQDYVAKPGDKLWLR